MKPFLLTSLLALTPILAQAQWAQNTEVTSPRENIYQLPASQFNNTVLEGRKHALFYPVDVSELLIPYQPMQTFFQSNQSDPVRQLLFSLVKVVSPFKNVKAMFNWLGLQDFPEGHQSENPNPLPTLTAQEKELPMGATLIENEDGLGMTFGCATCHAGNLFGVKVLGMSNRFPRANDFFDQGKKLAPYINSFVFQGLLHATNGEREMVGTAKKAVKYVGTKEPQVLGLDTSLAQVALSLAKREQDAYATRGNTRERANPLKKAIADSKPAVWWNVKYKNRWLSDGSIVSGNPVHTNFLWNEIGRGTDLVKLEAWMKENDHKIKALTAAVFATKSPRYEKFFGDNAIDIEKAKRGQAHYVKSCQRCHGVYEKGWDLPNAQALTKTQLLQNTKVTYHKLTPVRDVGTDPGRYLGMTHFASDLNRLSISKSIGTVVVPQKGYVPPPLDGIWARWPYFHNNSAPNLYSVLSKASQRPQTYWAGPALNKETDYDSVQGGYPLGTKVPVAWRKNPDYLYDTRREGLSNQGHDEGIFLKDGVQLYSESQKFELIEFLKTL